MKRPLRVLPTLVVALASASAVAQDRAYEPKALARYDVSYGQCETSFPDMKGHRDEAYLSLWRAKPNEKTKARLAQARGSSAYKTERQHAVRAAAKPPSAEAKTKVEQQCRALRGEMVKMSNEK